MSNKRPSITKKTVTRKPIEGPPRELLRWYGYDTNLSLEDEFPWTDNDTTDNDSSDDDTIKESQSSNCEGKLKVVLPRQRGREKCEMIPDHDVVKANTSVYLSFQHLFDFVLGFWIDFVKFSASDYLITYCVMFLRVRYLSMDLNVIYFTDVANKTATSLKAEPCRVGTPIRWSENCGASLIIALSVWKPNS
uniref:Uncharacterized protein n=1 Tax=Tanacetum cinerariifolium TaxID=118510 RepID=A0A699HZI7_TANCI|nr:hypothetical protein [Tanacetum cinerariifolium]